MLKKFLKSKLFLAVTLFFVIKHAFIWYTENLYPIPENLEFLHTLFPIVSVMFFFILRKYFGFAKRLILFFVLAPLVRSLLYKVCGYMEFEMTPFLNQTIYIVSFSMAGSLSTFLFFLIKGLIDFIISIVWSKPKYFIGRILYSIKRKFMKIFSIKERKNKSNVLSMVDNIKGNTHERGMKFEDMIAEAYRRIGFIAHTTTELRKNGDLPSAIQGTPGSGEQGVDVVVQIPPYMHKQGKGFMRMIVQCKLYSGKVGNKAVQEIYGAIPMYKADFGVVVTNNYFTDSAARLAASQGTELIDRDKLEELLKKSYKK